MIPGTLLFTYIGSSLSSIQEAIEGDYTLPPIATVFFICGLVATFALVYYLGALARRAMAEILEKYDDDDDNDHDSTTATSSDQAPNSTTTSSIE